MSEVEKLPQGWVNATLDEITEWGSGGTPKRSISKYYEDGHIPWVTITDLNNGIVNETATYITEVGVDESSAKLVPKDTILLALYGSIGKLGIAGLDLTTNQAIATAKPNPNWYENKYLFYYLESQAGNLNNLGSGVTQKNIYLKDVKNYQIPLAPRDEQRRIIFKLEELISEFENGVSELKLALDKLTQYRQSLLKSAVEGSLTQQWRAENSDRVQETGDQLLARILKQRREQWQQQKLAEFAEKGKIPPKNWQDKYPEPVQPDTTDLPELPKGWVWASVDQLVYESSYGTSVKCDYGTGNTPVLRIPNVINKKVSVSDLKETVDPFDIGLNKQLLSGDILIVRTNGSLSLMGQTALVRDIEDGFYFASYLLRLRTPMDTILPEWMDLYFGSKNARAWIENQASSSAGQNNISLSKFSNLHVPLPPLEEQVQLISVLANEFDSIDRQIEETELGLKQSEAQRKNILKSAFAGQLVPQDPNDEPASVLLEKIKQEREALAKLPKPRKPSKPKKKGEQMNTLLEVLTDEKDWIDAQDAFRKCGIADGSSTDRIEEIYTELRKLEKAGKIEIQRQGDYDQLKLIKQNVKED
ncbi:restriction endonuclease subunit S [Vibrio cholerae]|uniref:restriction endonuclease subunit S n=1 Tax=Vibrio cholerae TaxID=666 RepID=UPI00396754AC